MNDTFAATPTAVSTLTVTCLPGGRTFEATSEETILDAALRQGLMLPHSCRNGACGTCKTRLVDGQVDYRVWPLALTAEDAASGYALPCQARAHTAVALECSPINVDTATPMRRLVTRVQSLDKLAPDVMRIRLKMPANGNFAFYPGQHDESRRPDSGRRATRHLFRADRQRQAHRLRRQWHWVRPSQGDD